MSSVMQATQQQLTAKDSTWLVISDMATNLTKNLNKLFEHYIFKIQFQLTSHSVNILHTSCIVTTLIIFKTLQSQQFQSNLNKVDNSAQSQGRQS